MRFWFYTCILPLDYYKNVMCICWENTKITHIIKPVTNCGFATISQYTMQTTLLCLFSRGEEGCIYRPNIVLIFLYLFCFVLVAFRTCFVMLNFVILFRQAWVRAKSLLIHRLPASLQIHSQFLRKWYPTLWR